MDSKVVNKSLRAEVRPVLKKAGFSQFTTRTSWRFSGNRIDVVNFESFNSYSAECIGCTTYSFRLNLGCYLPYVPERYPLKQRKGNPCPEEVDCHFRAQLKRSFEQPEFDSRDPGFVTRNTWYVDPEGAYLGECVRDARDLLMRRGLLWFEQFADRHEVLAMLLEKDMHMMDLYGFGNPGSPNRNYLIGYVARALGDCKRAQHHLRLAAESVGFKYMASRLARDANRAGDEGANRDKME